MIQGEDMEFKNVKIESLDHLGRGIARIDNKITFIDNALEGEVVDIEIISNNKKYNEAKTTKIIKCSKDRRDVMCPYYNECGGCDLMHMNYEAELNFKKNKVINILKKYADVVIDPEVIKCNNEFNYRNKITLHYKDNKRGFYKNKTNDVIEIDKCLIARNKINEVLKDVKNKDKNIILRTNDKEVIYNKESYLIKEINNYKFRISLNSFFQVNDYICSKLFDLIENYIEKDEKVLDLYSGVSTLSIVASKNASKVIGIEQNSYASSDGEYNIELNNLSNVEAINSKVEDIVKDLKRSFDTLIIDPPRKGLDNLTTNFILNSKFKKIIYVSCDPMTLARDINILKGKYLIKDFKILDMFPNTHHVECVTVLSLKSGNK